MRSLTDSVRVFGLREKIGPNNVYSSQIRGVFHRVYHIRDRVDTDEYKVGNECVLAQARDVLYQQYCHECVASGTDAGGW